MAYERLRTCVSVAVKEKMCSKNVLHVKDKGKKKGLELRLVIRNNALVLTCAS